ncbi:MAG: hypothetical protein ABIB71_07415 [Candidatus Woesearchaeota archaeon]
MAKEISDFIKMLATSAEDNRDNSWRNTGAFLGGRFGYEIIKDNKPTGYFLGGRGGNSLINPEGKEIGFVRFPRSEILDSQGKPTGYFIGGRFSAEIFF